MSARLTLVAAAVFVAAVRTHTWDVASVAAIPLALRIGFSSAVRKSGIPMLRVGLRRVLFGRL